MSAVHISAIFLAFMVLASQAGIVLFRPKRKWNDERHPSKHRSALANLRLLLAGRPKEAIELETLSSLLFSVHSASRVQSASRQYPSRRSRWVSKASMWFWPVETKKLAQVELLAPLAAGNYGKVFSAKFHRGGNNSCELVAKIAGAKRPLEDGLAKNFLDSEATVHAAVAGFPGISTFVANAKTVEGQNCIVFERIRPLNGSDGPPTALADFLQGEPEQLPITPVEMLRQVLSTLASLHKANYIHRDIKLENMLLKPLATGISVEVIDLGAAVSVENCGAWGRMQGKCLLDEENHPCTLLYQAPEYFADFEYPFALDIYSAALCFLRLVWRDILGTDEAFGKFRTQLNASKGDLDIWLRTRLEATVLPEAYLNAFYRFPSNDPETFAAIRSMLNPDPSKRPSAQALLASSFMSKTIESKPDPVHGMNPETLIELLLDNCRVPDYDIIQRPLAMKVKLTQPYGLELEETDDDNGLIVVGILPDGSAAACDKLRVGDRLSAIGEVPLHGMTFEEAMGAIALVHASVGPEVELLFERSCTDEEKCDLPEDAIVKPTNSSAMDSLDSVPSIQDSGSYSIIGGRSTMEDTYVLTSFNVAASGGPRSFVLGAVFDGHRGDAASKHAAEVFAPVVSAAIAQAEPSPLAVGWRNVVETYLQSGNQDGSTASAILISDDGVAELLNCGDSRVVVGSKSGKVLYATRDHSAGSSSEMERIRQAGGSIECVGDNYRVAVDSPTLDGVVLVAVARALGGSEWIEGRISNAADISTLHLPPDTATITVATDGVWGVIDDSAEVVQFVQALRESGLSAGMVAQRLVQLARERGSRDNCAAIVLYK